MSKYLITLTPTGKFFFGGDMTFMIGDDEKDTYNEKYSSYYIKSSHFPQQTSLLGMLRFLILKNDANAFDVSKNKIIDKSEADTLIGEKGFRAEGENRKYGKISAIGPCFIMDGNEPVELDCLGHKYDFEIKDGKLSSSKYDPKEGIASIYEDVFRSDLRNGILKNDNHEDKALFKQENCRFNDQKKVKEESGEEKNVDAHYKFAFVAEVDDTLDLCKYDKQSVSLGADSSVFSIGITSIDGEKDDFVKSSKGEIKEEVVILTSPSYITNEEVELANSAITNVIPFRYLKTNTKTENYHDVSKRAVTDGMKDKYNLYDRGSVFFFDNESRRNEFCEKLKSHTNWYQIGFNHFNIK